MCVRNYHRRPRPAFFHFLQVYQLVSCKVSAIRDRSIYMLRKQVLAPFTPQNKSVLFFTFPFVASLSCPLILSKSPASFARSNQPRMMRSKMTTFDPQVRSIYNASYQNQNPAYSHSYASAESIRHQNHET